MSSESLNNKTDEISQLKLTVALLKIENEDRMKQKTYTDVDAFKQAISGTWKISSSTKTEKYLERQKGDTLDDILFQTANKNFEFNGNTLTVSDTVGVMEFHSKTVELSQPTFSSNGTAQITFISNNALKTVEISKENSENFDEERRFMSDEQLYIVTRKNGIECTRIYQKKQNLFEEDRKVNELETLNETLRVENEQLKMEYESELEELKDNVVQLEKQNHNLFELAKKSDEKLVKEAEKLDKIREDHKESNDQLRKLTEENDMLKLQNTINVIIRNQLQYNINGFNNPLQNNNINGNVGIPVAKPKPGRTFTQAQTDRLEAEAKLRHYPSRSDREALARQTGLTVRQIYTWFSNRRALRRRKTKQQSNSP